MSKIVIRHCLPGDLIVEHINKSIKYANDNNCLVQTDCNGVNIILSGKSNIDIIWRDYERCMSGKISGDVGPFPKENLSSEELEHDAEVEKKNKEKREKMMEEARKESSSKYDTLQEELKNSKDIEINNKDKYLEFKSLQTDSYSARIMIYAEDWARLMQKSIIDGKLSEDIIDKTSHLADYDGITGFMYSAAKRTLKEFWVYGHIL